MNNSSPPRRLLLLKATTTKTVIVPAYTDKRGRNVPAHSKLVHYDPNKEVHQVLAGHGSHSQKKALAKLSKLPHWHTLDAGDQWAHVLSSATNIQKKASQSAALSLMSAALVAGDPVKAAQWEAFHGLSPEQKLDFISKVEANGGEVGPLKFHAGIEDGSAKTTAPDPQEALQAEIDHLKEDAKQPDIPEHEKKEDTALVEKLEAAVAAPVTDDAIEAKVAAFATGAHYQKEAHKKLSADPGFAALPSSEKLSKLQDAYQKMQGAASAAAAVSQFVKNMKAGKLPPPAQIKAFQHLAGASPDKADKYSEEIGQAIGYEQFNVLMNQANMALAKKPTIAVVVKPKQPKPTVTTDVHAPAVDYLADGVGYQMVIESEAKTWLAANPSKGDELLAALLTHKHGDVAEKMELLPAKEQKSKTVPVQVTMAHFTNTTEGHNKFWAVGVHGKQMVVTYGKIGTMGQKNIKDFPSEVAALDAAMKLKHEKTAKGYTHKGSSAVAFELDAPAGKPSAQAAPEGSIAHLVDSLIEGEPVPSMELKAFTNKAKEDAVNAAVAGHGADPLNALNEIMSPHGYAEGTGPKEGDTKTINGVTYVLRGGKWHKQQAASKQPKPTKAEALADAIEAIPVPDFVGSDPTSGNSKYYAQIAASLKAAVLEHGQKGFSSLVTTHDGGAAFATKKATAKFKSNKCSAKSTTVRQKLFFEYCSALKLALDAHKGAKLSGAKVVHAPPPNVPPIAGTTAADAWQQTGPQKGSNAGGTFKDGNGLEWYCKFPGDIDKAKNEVLAAKLYAEAGVSVPEVKLISKDGKVGVASLIISGVSQGSASSLKAAAADGFATDAWLANHDVVGLGFDNLLHQGSADVVRIDVGGALEYRAQGAKKADFGNEANEIDSLRDPAKNKNSAAVFGAMTKAQIVASVKKVLAVSDDVIRDLCASHGPGTVAQRAELADKLIARKQFLAKKYPDAAKAEKAKQKKKLDPTALPVNPKDLPPYHDFKNWSGTGKGLSSKDHVNEANRKAEHDLLKFAMSGNLVALKDYKFEAFDKESGASLGMKPINEHPSQHVKLFHSDLVAYLDMIANPPEPLKVSAANDASSFKAEKFGATVDSVNANKKLGFWVALGKVIDAKPFVNHFVGKEKSVTSAAKTDAKSKFHALSKLAKHFISRVQSSGSYNDYFRDGKEKDGDGYSTAAVALSAYANAAEKPAGTTIYRWMNMPDAMVKQLLGAEPGLVFQNPGSMCCSMSPTSTSGFGKHRMVIYYAEGANGIDSFASGHFSGEHEITSLMGQRFVLLKSEMSDSLGGTGKKGLEVHVMMLPPDLAYIANLEAQAAASPFKKAMRFVLSLFAGKKAA